MALLAGCRTSPDGLLPALIHRLNNGIHAALKTVLGRGFGAVLRTISFMLNPTIFTHCDRFSGRLAMYYFSYCKRW